MSVFEQISKDLIEAIKAPKQSGTSPYDTTAEVTRIEGSTAWVHIPGGVDETPVKMSINCRAGDTVRLRVSGGQAWTVGNDTAPPTDDRTANAAQTTADAAQDTANTALASAQRAAEAADAAEASAAEAATAAEQAIEDAAEANTAAAQAVEDAATASAAAATADQKATAAGTAAAAAQTSADNAAAAASTAQTSADTANVAATSALTGLATVEDVVGTLNWITEHGTYATTSDTEVHAGKLYFTRSGSGTEADPYVYTVVDNPTGDPAALGYYELAGVDEAVANYVSTHLALTDEGLYVLSDGSGWRVLVSNDNVSIVSDTGTTVASYGSDIIMGDPNGQNYMKISSTGFGVTMDGGVTETLAAKLFEGTQTQTTQTVGHDVSLYPHYQFYTSIIEADSRIIEGTQLTLDAYFTSSQEEGHPVYHETMTFVVGTASAEEAFVYSDYNVTFYYDGYYRIAAASKYPWFVTIKSSTSATYYIQTERSAYFTLGDRTASSQIGKYSVAEGLNVTGSGDYSHVEGYGSTASGNHSHAEGYGTTASGVNSHAEGSNTTASQAYAHAEGGGTTASAFGAHAEGSSTVASGSFSHAGGQGTTAAGDHQTAIGKYNVIDPNQEFALIIGNGTANLPGNAFTIDWDGNTNPAGNVEMEANKTVDGVDVSELPCHIITSGSADLNNYRTEGTYYFSSGVTLSNAPNGAVNGWLQVLPTNGGAVKQFWYRFGSNGGTPPTYTDFYERTYSGAEWLAWERIVTEKLLTNRLGSYVPTTRTVNGHALSSDVMVTSSDVGLPLGSGIDGVGHYISSAGYPYIRYRGTDDKGYQLVVNASGIRYQTQASSSASWVNGWGLEVNDADGKTASTVSAANATDTTLCNSGSLTAGTYLLIGTASFASSTAGRRALFLSTSSTGGVINRWARTTVPPTSGGATQVQVVMLANFTSATTVYLRAYQNSGGALNITDAGIQFIKLH